MIDKYKKGELSEEQTEQLEADLMRQMFRKEKENALRSDLKKLAASISDTENTEGVATNGLTVSHRSNRSWTWLAAAASVAILVVAGWWLFLKPQTIEPFNNETLADTYLKKDASPVWSATMGNETPEEKEAKAKEAYQKNDFTQAISLFEAIPPTTKEHFFYLGVAALKQQKPDAQKTIDNLLKARTLANGWQEDATNWYLALAYIRLGKITEARTELNNIIKIGRDNVNSAKELLQKLPAL
jgi:tetratricopeptide (TPR) repeat protein